LSQWEDDRWSIGDVESWYWVELAIDLEVGTSLKFGFKKKNSLEI
jgi:hypothetical protein